MHDLASRIAFINATIFTRILAHGLDELRCGGLYFPAPGIPRVSRLGQLADERSLIRQIQVINIGNAALAGCRLINKAHGITPKTRCRVALIRGTGLAIIGY